MATLVLTAVGTVFGGPLAGVAAGVLGFAGQALFGGSGSRTGPRLNDLSVQSSAYGTPLPRLYGTTRAAGSVIWATEIQEAVERSGGGKGKPKTTTYSYSVSFAVALSARPIHSIKRIWADGKLIRTESGEWIVPATMRLHDGWNNLAPDLLIQSAEGIGQAPAYRGMAYVVFEDLELAEFANHIPSMSFEIVADPEPTDAARIVDDLCDDKGFAASRQSAEPVVLPGFGIASGSIRNAVAALADISPMNLVDDGMTLAFDFSTPEQPLQPADSDLGTLAEGSSAPRPPRIRNERLAADKQLSEVAVAYHDISRDYQTGLQRAWVPSIGRTEQIELPAALAPGEAKAIAERRIERARMGGVVAGLSLPWRCMAWRPGDLVRDPDDGTSWMITGWSFERFVLELELVRHIPSVPREVPAADVGRSAFQDQLPNGPTVLGVFDLPPLFDDVPSQPRLWLAATGETRGWKRAQVSVSLDGDSSWDAISPPVARV